MLIDCEVHCCHISCVIFGQLSVSVSFLGPCCPAPLYCIAVYDCLMLTERINDDDDDDIYGMAKARYLKFCTVARQVAV